MPCSVLIGILGLVAIAACWALATVLFRVSTPRTTARKLAVLLVIEGLVLATAGFPEFAFGIPDSVYEEHPTLLFILGAIHHLGDAAMVALYPPFLALALNSKLTRSFSEKRARIALAVGSAVMGLFVVVKMTQRCQTPITHRSMLHIAR